METPKIRYIHATCFDTVGKLRKCPQCRELMAFRTLYAYKGYCPGFYIYAYNHYVHFQLAVLAIYVGDEFLALYHCIRSLAVKDPFPDAWNNLILLFERVRLKLMLLFFFTLFSL